MSQALEEHRDTLLRAAPVLADTLDACVADAARQLSPAALTAWLEGAATLARLGRGAEPVLACIEALPKVARECGEAAIGSALAAALRLASLTSGSVLALLLSGLPAAAARIGDAAMLEAYLQLVHRLASRAPRGLRPMLTHAETLLGRLSLSGLQRWVEFGIEAYRHDADGQARYFALETDDSQAVLKRERRGTLFIDQQRRLNFTLRAFWGRDFFLRPALADSAAFRPFIEGGMLHLADAVDVGEGSALSGGEIYRAMAAHMAAHVMHTAAALSPQALTPAQCFLVGFIEDARVERFAAAAFPGLGRLWRALLPEPASVDGHPALARLAWLARALAAFGAEVGVSTEAGGAPWQEKSPSPLPPQKEEPLAASAFSPSAALADIVARFHAEVDAHPRDARLSLTLGLALHHALQQDCGLPSLAVLASLPIAYRDDNRFLWVEAECAWAADPAGPPSARRQQRRRIGLMAFVNEVDTETAGDDADEVWVLDGVLYDDDGSTWNAREGKAPVSDPYPYPEWDHRAQLYRPDWATVYEHRPRRGDPARVDGVLEAHKPVVARIRQIIDRLRPQGVTRMRGLEDGDELDLNAAVDAVVALRSGRVPDMRITMRNVVHERDLSVLILLDLSESTNEALRGSTRSVLALTIDACALLATAIAGIGDPFAIHGFASDGRHDVRYTRFKDFGQRFDDAARARLAAMQGGLSTRMGTAMRHGGRLLKAQPGRCKLLLVISDGEPADVDERDPQTLREDARKAVEQLATEGVRSYCLTLDSSADRYVERIFGAGRYTIIDHVDRLPERLPTLFASLTR